MPHKSLFPDLKIPRKDIISYIFPPDEIISREPIWINALDPSKNLSPWSLFELVKRFGAGLQDIGLGAERDVGLIFTPNHIFVPVAYLGMVAAGVTFSGCNPTYTESELLYQLKDTGAKILLFHPDLLDTALAVAKKANLPTERLFFFSDSQHQPVNGVRDWREILSSPERGRAWVHRKLTPEESLTKVATINYSSGTTGLPKGVCLSHYNIIANIEQANFLRYYGEPHDVKNHPVERWVGYLPLYHAYGQLYILMTSIRKNPIFIMEKFHFETFLKVIERHKITTLHLVPPIVVLLNKREETTKYDLSSVTEMSCGAAPLSKELEDSIMGKFGVHINQGYGMTETTSAAISSTPALYDGTGSVGLQMPNTEVKLLNDEGCEVNSDEPGELYIRGPQVCLGYWGNAVATADTIDTNGWLRTGDIVIRSKEGRFWIVDRKKEMIKVNALQVAPAELEAVLLEHPDIADAGVVGVKTDDLERPKAYIVLGKDHTPGITPEYIQNWFKGRVAKHKYLEGGVVFVDVIPRLASGKIKRKVLRDWASKDGFVLNKGVLKAHL